MTNDNTNHSAKAFDPVAFAEWWLEHKWAEKNPHELRRYLEALDRRGGEEPKPKHPKKESDVQEEG